MLDVLVLLTLNKNQSPEVFLDLQQVQLLHPSRRPPDPSEGAVSVDEVFGDPVRPGEHLVAAELADVRPDSRVVGLKQS